MNSIAQKIVNHIGLKNVVSISLAPFQGDVNETYIVDLRKGKQILRFNDDKGIEQFKKEKWAIEKSKALNIPVADVHDIGEFENYSYMLQEYIHGTNGDNASKEDQVLIATKMGEYAKRLSSISVSGWGETITDYENGVFSQDWNKYIRSEINWTSNKDDYLVSQGLITDKQRLIIVEMFKNLLSKNVDIGITHNDLSLDNAIITDDNVFLIDFGCVESTAYPYMDILELMNVYGENSEYLNNFLNGYGVNKNWLKDNEIILNSIRLLLHIDRYRWAFENSKEIAEEYKDRLQNTISKIF